MSHAEDKRENLVAARHSEAARKIGRVAAMVPRMVIPQIFRVSIFNVFQVPLVYWLPPKGQAQGQEADWATTLTKPRQPTCHSQQLCGCGVVVPSTRSKCQVVLYLHLPMLLAGSTFVSALAVTASPRGKVQPVSAKKPPHAPVTASPVRQSASPVECENHAEDGLSTRTRALSTSPAPWQTAHACDGSLLTLSSRLNPTLTSARFCPMAPRPLLALGHGPRSGRRGIAAWARVLYLPMYHVHSEAPERANSGGAHAADESVMGQGGMLTKYRLLACSS